MSITKVSAMMSTGTKGGDIPSASTLVIDTDGDYFDITGTTGITAMTVDAGRRFTLQFDGALTLTHGSSLYLPGATNFTTEANDSLDFIATAANTVRCTSYALKDGGTPVPGGVSAYSGYASRNQNTASGTQAVTGVGFTPKIVYFLCGMGGTNRLSWGFGTSSDNRCVLDYHSANPTSSYDTYSSSGDALKPMVDNSNHQKGSINSMDADGFTITWTKVGSPASATMEIHFFAIG
jgi:hypothetical protein